MSRTVYVVLIRFVGLIIKMTTYVKNEVAWLPSQEVVVKQEKESSLETWTNPSEHSYPEVIECKPEITHEIFIKEEHQEPIEDANLSPIDSEYVNHSKTQTDGTLKGEDCEKVNCNDLGFMKKKYGEHTESSENRLNNTLYGLRKENLTDFIGYEQKQTGEKSFVCNVCNKMFQTKQHLTTHVRIHTGEKPFSCDLCDKKFTDICNLVRHKKAHTGEKPFSCDLCDKQFIQKCDLTKHKVIHTGEKPFSCDMCNQKFTRRDTLVKHKRTHTGEKPFSCDICNKQFIQKFDMNKHRRVHTGEKPYSCDICQRKFTGKCNLTKHLKTHARRSLSHVPPEIKMECD